MSVMGDPNQIAGTPELWKVEGGGTWLAYSVPGSAERGTDLRIVWMVEHDDQLEAWYGTTTPTFDKTMSMAEFQQRSPWNAGLASEIQQTDDDPWTLFMSDFNEARQLRPWLNDPDMLSLMAVAYLEGRAPTSDEISKTQWWQTHNAAQREWMEKAVTLGSKEIDRLRKDQILTVTRMMEEAGINKPHADVAGFIAEQWLTGRWSEQIATTQIRKLGDPSFNANLSGRLKQFIDKNKIQMNTTREGEDKVRGLFREWLGPVMGAADEATLRTWSGRLRNDPDAEIALVEHLRQQRKAMFPDYANEDLKYEDIVGPVRNLATNIWGQPMDERRDETMLVSLANSGDFTEMQRRLRRAGLDRNITKVVNDAVGSLGNTALGEQVVQSRI